MTPESRSPQLASHDALIEACLRGSQPAWEAIVQQYRRRVFNIAYKFVGAHAEAEDLTQEIFLKLFRALKTFDRRANFETWLISIARNLCIDHYRSARRERAIVDRGVEATDLPSMAVGPTQHRRLERRDRLALLRRAMEELPPALRTAVLLRDIQELSYQEIARRLNVPEGTVKSRINRGRQELGRHILRLDREQHAALADTPRAPAVRPAS